MLTHLKPFIVWCEAADGSVDYVRQHLFVSERDIRNAACCTGATSDNEPAMLVLGNSTAARLTDLLDKVGEPIGDAIRNVVPSVCAPIIDESSRLNAGHSVKTSHRSTCSAQVGGDPVFYDGGQLSIDGSVRVGEMAIEDEAMLPKLVAS